MEKGREGEKKGKRNKRLIVESEGEGEMGSGKRERKMIDKERRERR
jgi:hypothetical protein